MEGPPTTPRVPMEAPPATRLAGSVRAQTPDVGR